MATWIHKASDCLDFAKIYDEIDPPVAAGWREMSAWLSEHDLASYDEAQAKYEAILRATPEKPVQFSAGQMRWRYVSMEWSPQLGRTVIIDRSTGIILFVAEEAFAGCMEGADLVEQRTTYNSFNDCNPGFITRGTPS